MKKLEDLKKVVKKGLDKVKSDKTIIEGVVYASSNKRTVGRIVYTSHIPCNGLEEPKSDEDFGVCVEVWFKKGGKKLVGIGQEPNELSEMAVERALIKAKQDAVEDPDFTGFLKLEDLPREARVLPGYHDSKVMDIAAKEEAEILAKISWETIRGAVEAISSYSRKRKISSKKSAFILNGDNFLIKERMALSTTNGIFDFDETTVILSFLTAMLEKENSKGSSWGGRLTLDDFSAYEIGKKAALAAVAGVGAKRIKSGSYNVIFGPQAVTELFGNLLLTHLNLAMTDLGATIFQGKYGKEVASKLLTLYDDATLPGGAGTKRITCEGCPTGKTLLIEKGVLVGYLSDSRTTNKVLIKSEEAKKKIGVDPHEIKHAISPRNGFRFSRGGGRVATSGIGIHATNLVVDTPQPLSESELLSKVKHGIYIGRLWYTYPVGGYSSGIISGTAVADNFIIRNGKLDGPVLPNTIRLEDNLGEMLNNIIGISGKKTPTIVWASDEITHAPLVAIKQVRLKEIGRATL